MPDPAAERRSTWTHPNLVGRDAPGAPGAGAPTAGAVPGPVSPVPATPATGALPAAASGTTSAEAADGADGDGPDGQDSPARGRWPLVAGVVAAVLVLGGGGAAYLLTRDGDGTAAAPPDVVLPSPTTTVEPVARTATSAFASALPLTVLQYALASSVDEPVWVASGAVEAYTETYTDGAEGQVSVVAGQWETPEEAEAVLVAQTASLPGAGTATPADDAAAEGSSTDGASDAAGAAQVLLTGDVLVDGAPTGTVTVVDGGDGTGTAVWRNGTTVFRVVGPAADIRNLYAAFPL